MFLALKQPVEGNNSYSKLCTQESRTFILYPLTSTSMVSSPSLSMFTSFDDSWNLRIMKFPKAYHSSDPQILACWRFCYFRVFVDIHTDIFFIYNIVFVNQVMTIKHYFFFTFRRQPQLAE